MNEKTKKILIISVLSLLIIGLTSAIIIRTKRKKNGKLTSNNQNKKTEKSMEI